VKSALSCLGTLLVLAIVILGASWVYREVGKGGGDRFAFLTATSPPKLALQNQTRAVLTVTLTGPGLERFQIAPGHSEVRTLRAGTYAVEGRISDPDTEPFYGEWTLEEGGTYDGGFGSDQDGLVLILAWPPAEAAQKHSPGP
jgi:hypothetical protein